MLVQPCPEPQRLLTEDETTSTTLTLLFEVPHRGQIVGQDLDGPSAKGRVEGLERQPNCSQFKQTDVQKLLLWRAETRVNASVTTVVTAGGV